MGDDGDPSHLAECPIYLHSFSCAKFLRHSMASFTAVRSLGLTPRPVASRPFRRTAIRAEPAQDEKKFFGNNALSNRGYLEEDSAGQENIFAVQPKRYVQGSSVDDTTGAAGNTFFGVAGAALAVVVIAAGTGALFVQDSKTKASSSLSMDVSNLSTLSQYKAKFAAEIRQPASAEAPDV